MLKIRVKKEDAIYINGRKFIVAKINPVVCEIWNKNDLFKIGKDSPQKIEGLNQNGGQCDGVPCLLF